jgi:hypothetical protein
MTFSFQSSGSADKKVKIHFLVTALLSRLLQIYLFLFLPSAVEVRIGAPKIIKDQADLIKTAAELLVSVILGAERGAKDHQRSADLIKSAADLFVSVVLGGKRGAKDHQRPADLIKPAADLLVSDVLGAERGTKDHQRPADLIKPAADLLIPVLA